LKGSGDKDSPDYFNHLKFGLSNGLADHEINVWSAYFEYQRIINQDFSVDLKLNFQAYGKDDISTSGLSDIFINGNYRGFENMVLTLGLKIPLRDGNILKEGLALPMDYQTSLGTFDLILGAAYKISNLTLAVALQQPLSQNENSFLTADYPSGSPFKEFVSTNQYKRKGDLLVRGTYSLNLGKRITVIPGLLAIFHLGDDEYTTAGGATEIIDGSAGLTFNGTLYLIYALSHTSSVELSFGAPFITRTTRPDGLTRDYVVTIDYSFRF
jgi:hypothetical protein